MTTLALHSAIDPAGAPASGHGALVARAARLTAGVMALALGSAVLFSAPVMASGACSGEVMMVETIVLPDLAAA